MVDVVGIDQSVFKRVTCTNCASILQYTPDEVDIRNACFYDGSREQIEFIICPKCSKEVPI